MERFANRRMLSSPVVITWPASMLVIRVIGAKIWRRPNTSTTSPTTRGCETNEDAPGRITTTTSRTLPTWSPCGSNTGSPARRAAKTRVGVVLTEGNSRWVSPGGCASERRSACAPPGLDHQVLGRLSSADPTGAPGFVKGPRRDKDSSILVGLTSRPGGLSHAIELRCDRRRAQPPVRPDRLRCGHGADSVRSALASMGDTGLILEITERDGIGTDDVSLRAMQQLADAGVPVRDRRLRRRVLRDQLPAGHAGTNDQGRTRRSPRASTGTSARARCSGRSR